MRPQDDGTPLMPIADQQAGLVRQSWSTPRVIVSEIYKTQAHVTNNPPDGSSSGVKFGS